MALFEARLYRPAKRFLSEADADERQELGRIIDQVLCHDPYIDNKSKLTFPMPPAMLQLFSDGKYWIIYHIHRNTEIRIWNIGYADEPPVPYREDED